MQAVILAAGEGRRLDPLTELRPKPMLPLANKPILEYVIEAVAEAGIEEIVLVVGYKRERIQDHFGDGIDWNVDIEYAVQEKQLGTGHAILQAEPIVDGTFLVLNGDRIIEPTIVETLVEESENNAALLAITHTTRPHRFGVVEVTGETVESIVEKPTAFESNAGLINAGVYRFGTDIFDVLRETDFNGELAVTAGLRNLVDDGRVRGVRYDGMWLDVSLLWDLIEGNAVLLDGPGRGIEDSATPHESCVLSEAVAAGADTAVGPNSTVLSGTTLGDNVSVGSNVVLSNTVVFADATIRDGTVLRDCIVGANATVGPNTTITGGPADVVVDGVVYEGVRLGAVIGDNVTVGGAVTFSPGTVVGTGSRIEDGCTLDGRVPSAVEVRRG